METVEYITTGNQKRWDM